MTHASFSSARHMQFIATLSHNLKLRVFYALGLFIAVAAFGSFANAQTITFESPTYTIGSINGQDGWSSTGPYDQGVIANTTAPVSFGAQSFRISNAVTSGGFGDQTFSRPTVNEAGETDAHNGGFSGGTRQNNFVTQFNIASADPTAQQPGLVISTSQDRGDGARMSYLRFEDQADGIHVFFNDYQDRFPYGTALGDSTNGCGVGDDFYETDIATLSRTDGHSIKIVTHFVDGPRNDVVQVYIDGILKKTGTTWEDYFRYCSEQSADNQTKTVDSQLFRAGGASAPGTSGKGFLIDGLSLVSAPTTSVTVNPSNTHNWFFYNDETDTVDNTLGTFVSGPDPAPEGTGSAKISVTGTQRRNLATYQFAGTPLANITALAFSTYNPSAGNGGALDRSAYLNFNVDFNGSDTWQRRLVFIPSQNGPVIQNAWKEWDAIDGGNAKWGYSGATWPAGVGGGGEPGTTLKTWSQILTQYSGVRIRVTDAFVGLRVGEPYNDGYTEYLDGFKFGTAAGTTDFNFDPDGPTTVVVTPSSLNGWTTAGPVADNRPVSTVDFISDPSTPIGYGALKQTTDATTASKSQLMRAETIPLSQITDLSYFTKQNSASFASGDASFQLIVYLDGTAANFTTLVFEPYENGTVIPGAWQQWNVAAGQMWSSKTRAAGGSCNVTAGAGGPPYYTLAGLQANCPNAVVEAYGVNVGTFNPSYDVETDMFRVNGTIYDFDPDRPSVTINQDVAQADPTSSSPINFAVSFSTPVTGFDSTDVVLGGTAGATTAVVTGSGTTYNVAVSGMTGSGTVTATIPDGAAVDASNLPSTASTSTDNGVTYFTCNNVSVPPSTMVPRNTQFTVPITTDDLTGRGVISYDFTLNYDPGVVTPISVNKAGTLSSGMDITYNNTSGSLIVGAAGTAPLSGSGTLLTVTFISTSGIGTTSPLNFQSFMYNEGVPCSNATDGTVTVISGTVSGAVTYVNAPGPATVPVPNVTLNGAGSVAVSGTTDANGQYSLSGFGAGPYTVTPSKTGNVNGITSFDSAKISQHVVHLITLNTTQQMAADVSGNGTISSFDSALVSQYVVHIPNTSSTGTWKFVPPSRSYTDLETDHTGEDYGAILMGEVTGNWTPTAPNQLFAIESTRDSGLASAAIRVTAPTTSVPVSSNFTIPLAVQDTTGQGIISYQYILNFDKNVIVPQTNPCDLTGSISSSLTATCNPATPGVLEVSVFGTMPINGSGVLMNLKFTAVGAQGTVSPLTVNSFMFNEGIPQNSITNGQVTVQIVTAAQASVSGMVMRQNGIGVRNARVSLTDANGNARTVRTNQFGFYRIDGLTVGVTYVVDVSAKGLTFEPQTLTVTGNMNSVNLIGQH
ncbi:MAG TPA: cohesin domain-containing protein [Pyrinomonadaceae bacterium]|nr:cohesin domain-containing protein [Pyrinomonadaceae bacterium]